MRELHENKRGDSIGIILIISSIRVFDFCMGLRIFFLHLRGLQAKK